jgi:hypothetical protein
MFVSLYLFGIVFNFFGICWNYEIYVSGDHDLPNFAESVMSISYNNMNLIGVYLRLISFKILE